MSVRKLTRMAVPTAVAALTLAAGIAPSQAAGSKGWRVVSAIGTAGDESVLLSATASGPKNAWAAGFDCGATCQSSSPNSAQLLVGRWQGKSWRQAAMPATLPGVGDGLGTVSIGSSSAKNTWVFAADPSGNPFAVRFNGHRWTQKPLPAWFFSGPALGHLAAEVLGPRDVWAFSGLELTGSNTASFAAHYNGAKWAKVPLRGVPMGVSAISSTSLWVVEVKGIVASSAPAARPGMAGAGRAAARFGARVAASSKISETAQHWTGRRFRNVKMPSPYLSRGRIFVPLAAASAGRTSVWVTGLVISSKGQLLGSQLLFWNGHNWRRTAVPGKRIDEFSAMTVDGKGGVWVDLVPIVLSGTPQTFLAHYAHGRWTSQLAPQYNGGPSMVASLAWIPGTTSNLGAGAVEVTSSATLGAVLRHGK